MDQRKKEIIIQEIKYWKAHKLLPEKYCDFLLTLYTEGDTKENNRTKIQQFFLIVSIFFLTSLIPITYLINYFTEIQINLQIGLYITFFIFNLLASWILYKKSVKIYQVPLINAALILLLASTQISSFYFPRNNGIMIATISGNIFIWIVSGYSLRITYLKIAGALAIVILLLYLFLT